MNKKIPNGIALGIILMIAVIIGGLIFLNEKKYVQKETRPIAVDPSTNSMPPSYKYQIISDNGYELVKNEIIVSLQWETPNPAKIIANIASETGTIIIKSDTDLLMYTLWYDFENLDALKNMESRIEKFEYVEFASPNYIPELID